MESREIVRRCIEFDHPPRIAWHFHTEPIAGWVCPETDFCCVGPDDDPRYVRPPGATEWTTEWGDVRSTLHSSIGEAVRFPLAEDWSLLDSYAWPDLARADRYPGAKRLADAAHREGKYVYGWVPGLMLQAVDLRGMENWLTDHLLEPEHLARLLDGLTAIRDAMIARYHELGADGVITWDDMGSEQQAFVRPSLFRELYFERYRHAIASAHARGMHFIHHCCGQVREYLDLFVEAKLDVLQLDQPELMGIDWLADRYAGRLCFWNSVDIQRTMGRGRPEAVADEVKKQIARLGNGRGGFMLKAYQQPEDVHITREEMRSMITAAKTHGHHAPSANRYAESRREL